MMSIGQLFVYAVLDLEACMRSKWHYQRMRMGGLLRLLLIRTTEEGLLEQLQQEFTFNGGYIPHFETAPVPPDFEHRAPPPEGFEEYLKLDLDPMLPWRIGQPTVHLTLEEFLSRPLGVAGKTPFTVRHVIENVAYVRGATHAGVPLEKRRPADPSMTQWRQFPILLQDPALEQLKEIAVVVYRTVAPIADNLTTLAFRVPPPARWEYLALDVDGKEIKV